MTNIIPYKQGQLSAILSPEPARSLLGQARPGSPILGTFGNVVSARQAMLDHAGLADPPTEGPWFGPAARVIEGCLIGSTEYLIEF